MYVWSTSLLYNAHCRIIDAVESNKSNCYQRYIFGGLIYFESIVVLQRSSVHIRLEHYIVHALTAHTHTAACSRDHTCVPSMVGIDRRSPSLDYQCCPLTVNDYAECMVHVFRLPAMCLSAIRRKFGINRPYSIITRSYFSLYTL